MAEMRVTSATLSQKKSELEQLNSQLVALKGQYESVEQAMNSKWDGDAKTAFHATFTQNMAAIDTFTKEVTNYITALQNIITKYETTEAENQSIAASR